MKDLHLTSPKGMNGITKKTMDAKSRGTVTDGASSEQGYKVLPNNVGHSPQAVALNRGQKKVNDND